MIELMTELRHFSLPQTGSQTITKTAKDVNMKLHYRIKIINFLSKLYDLEWLRQFKMLLQLTIIAVLQPLDQKVRKILSINVCWYYKIIN